MEHKAEGEVLSQKRGIRGILEPGEIELTTDTKTRHGRQDITAEAHTPSPNLKKKATAAQRGRGEDSSFFFTAERPVKKNGYALRARTCAGGGWEAGKLGGRKEPEIRSQRQDAKEAGIREHKAKVRGVEKKRSIRH